MNRERHQGHEDKVQEGAAVTKAARHRLHVVEGCKVIYADSLYELFKYS